MSLPEIGARGSGLGGRAAETLSGPKRSQEGISGGAIGKWNCSPVPPAFAVEQFKLLALGAEACWRQLRVDKVREVPLIYSPVISDLRRLICSSLPPLPLHGERIRVLHFEPIARAAGTVRGILAAYNSLSVGLLMTSSVCLHACTFRDRVLALS